MPTEVKIKRKAVWLSFDLGVQGDYESLYRWLDAKEAEECGDNLAFLKLPFEADVEHFAGHVKAQLQGAIKVDAKTRIYLIFKGEKGNSGQFLFGQRRAPPWSGYAPKQAVTEDKSDA